MSVAFVPQCMYLSISIVSYFYLCLCVYIVLSFSILVCVYVLSLLMYYLYPDVPVWDKGNKDFVIRDSGDWWNLINSDYLFLKYIDGLLQDCSISGALGMKILLFCTKPSIYASGNYTGSTHHSNLVVAGYLTRWSDKMRVKICVAECFKKT